MDYSLAEAFSSTNVEGLSRAIVIYDIMCQYWPKLNERWNRKQLSVPTDLEIHPAIGLLHVHGHKEACMPPFSCSYVVGIGRTAGEILETLWSSLNEVSRSTQSASLPHRAEVLDDHMQDNNWKKLLKTGGMCHTTSNHHLQLLVGMISKKYREAVREEPYSGLFLENLEEGLSSRVYEQWRKDIEAAEAGRLGRPDGMLLYLPNIDQGQLHSAFRGTNLTDM